MNPRCPICDGTGTREGHPCEMCAARAEIDRLRACLANTADELEHALTYVDAYFITKHDMTAALAEARRVLGETP